MLRSFAVRSFQCWHFSTLLCEVEGTLVTDINHQSRGAELLGVLPWFKIHARASSTAMSNGMTHPKHLLGQGAGVCIKVRTAKHPNCGSKGAFDSPGGEHSHVFTVNYRQRGPSNLGGTLPHRPGKCSVFRQRRSCWRWSMRTRQPWRTGVLCSFEMWQKMLRTALGPVGYISIQYRRTVREG